MNRLLGILFVGILLTTAGCFTINVEDENLDETPIDAPSLSEPAMTEPRRAEAGVGKQGQALQREVGDDQGVKRIIAQPALTLFQVKQRVVFEIQIPQAMQLYEASNGRGPKSHDEFMNKIIRDNNIVLPELPEGAEYQYHPESKELWVHPKATTDNNASSHSSSP
jgi:hypothetical protein